MSGSTLFSGTSRYSSDFTAIIERAVAIASLPLMQMQLAKQRLEAESSAIGSLNAKVMAVQNAISSLNNAAGLSSFSTSISNGAVLNATVGTGAFSGTYTIEVTSLGAYSTVMSKDGLERATDPSTQTISANPNPVYTLNGVEIRPASNTLKGLAAAINSAGLDIQATVVNIGSGTEPDYRLALQSTKLGPVAMQLNDGTTDLFPDDPPNGFYATYKVNGVDALPSDSRTITLAPGLTATLLSEGTATVTVSRSTTAIQNAISSLVNSYNAAVDELEKHRGPNAGALAGQGLILTVWDSLRSIIQYTGGTGKFSSMTDLGLAFDQEGRLSFDVSAFQKAAENYDELIAFLGKAGEGGFLNAATGIMDSLENDTNGILTTAANSINASIVAEGKHISETEDRIENLRRALTEQMAAADALIATLEQQAIYLNSMFEAMRITAQKYR